MTYYVIVLSNDRARLIQDEVTTRNKELANSVAAYYAGQGYTVVRKESW